MDLLLPLEGAEARLLCPHCHGSYVHHMAVDVYFRPEDGVSTHVRIDQNERSALKPEGNPSRRRDGLSVGFHCETCPGHFWLTLVQHKGETYLSTINAEPTEAERKYQERMGRESTALDELDGSARVEAVNDLLDGI